MMKFWVEVFGLSSALYSVSNNGVHAFMPRCCFGVSSSYSSSYSSTLYYESDSSSDNTNSSSISSNNNINSPSYDAESPIIPIISAIPPLEEEAAAEALPIPPPFTPPIISETEEEEEEEEEDTVASSIGTTAGGPLRRIEQKAYQKSTNDIFDLLQTVKIQGGSLRTCSFSESADRVSVYLRTEGRPLNANVELWQGPDNTPQKMTVYLEDGSIRPFRATLESPGDSNAVAIRNTGNMEFPITAGLEVDMSGIEGSASIMARLSKDKVRTVQGGAVYTLPFPPNVMSVQILLLNSDGRPLNAKIELLQGPNNNKQTMEVYSEDGNARPFFCVLDTPGDGNVVRIVNTSTVEFPISASIEPFIVDGTTNHDYSSTTTWT